MYISPIMIVAMTTRTERRTQPRRIVGDWWRSLALPVACLAGIASGPADALDLAEYRGQVVIVDFWASWCVPCRQSFPWLNAMYDEYSDDGLVILGVNTNDDAAEAQQFLEEFPAKFEIVYDPEGQLAQEFGVVAMPSSFVFSRDGELDTRHLGFLRSRREEYEAVIQRLIAEPGR